MDFLSLLQQPITQIAAVVAVVAGLQKAGVDVGALFKALFGMKQSPTEKVDFDNRTALQQLLDQMQILSGHYNHDTTELLTEIRDSLKGIGMQLTSNFTAIHAKHDEWDRRGIPTEDCKKNK